MGAFQVAMLLAQAALTVLIALMGIFINHMLQRLAKLQERDEQLVEDMRELERVLFPRAEFQRHEDFATGERHNIKERITALEIRAGAWATNGGAMAGTKGGA